MYFALAIVNIHPYISAMCANHVVNFTMPDQGKTPTSLPPRKQANEDEEEDEEPEEEEEDEDGIATLALILCSFLDCLLSCVSLMNRGRLDHTL